MRTCAVCSKPIRKEDVCNNCKKEWKVNGVYPDWVTELIKIQHSFECNKAAFEVVVDDFDENAYKFVAKNLGKKLPKHAVCQ